MADSVGTTSGVLAKGRDLVHARKFKAALELFRNARSIASTEAEKAYVLLGDEECQLHLRLPADDGPEALEAALSIFRNAGDARAEAWALICLGIRAQSRGEFNGAVALLDEASRIASAVGDREAEARALLDRASMLNYRREPGDTEKMADSFVRGYALAMEGDAYEKAVADATRGLVRYAMGDLADAARGYRAAVEGFSGLDMQEQALETSVALGVTLYRSGERENSEAVFTTATETAQSLGRNVEGGVAFMYLGQLAESSSRYAMAFGYYSEAERYLQAENKYGVTLRLGQARALCAMGRFGEAWSRLELVSGNLSASARVSLPMLKAGILAGMGRYSEAAGQADSAVKEASSCGMARQEADARAVRMENRCRMDEESLAEADALTILGPLAASAAASVKGRALTVLATAARKRGSYGEAADQASAACALLEEIDSPLYRALALAEKGKDLLDLNDVAGADAAFGEACAQALAVRRDAPESYRIDFLDSLRGIFAQRISFLVARGRVDEAFRAALRLIARSLTERLGMTGEEALPDLGSTAEITFLPLGGVVVAFVRTSKGLAVRMLPFALSTESGSSGAVHADRNSAADYRGFALARGGAADARTDPMQLAVGAFKTAITTDSATFRDMAVRLYTALFIPLEDLLAGADEWILCPAGALSGLPFEALVGRNGKYLIEGKKIVYVKSPLLAGHGTNSAPSDGNGAERNAKRKRRVLAVGDPTSEGGPMSEGDPERGPEGIQALPALPGAASEATAACEWADEASLLVGAKATKRAFLELAGLGSWDTVHIAAHALFAETGEEGAILFHHDGDPVLSSREIAVIRMDVHRVVLSACASGLGKKSWSEGSVGLVGAFMAAGVGSIHATLWRIQDYASAKLLVATYRNAARSGDGFEMALLETRRAAMRGELGEDCASPSVWASWVQYRS